MRKDSRRKAHTKGVKKQERFACKAPAIGEAKNLETMKLKELIGSLWTFEMELEEDKKQRKRTMTF